MFSVFVATRSFCLQRSLHNVLSVKNVDLILWDLSIRYSFPLVPSTYGKVMLILISYSWIYLACICCCYKLWLIVILFNILLIMFSWHLFCFDTCFILALSFLKSSLFVTMEYALLNKEETTLSLQQVWWWDLQCRYWSVCVESL